MKLRAITSNQIACKKFSGKGSANDFMIIIYCLGRGHSQRSSSLCQQVWSIVNNSLAVTISSLNRLLITLIHRVECALAIIWARNIILRDLNPTPSASRAIALPTRPHHPINFYYWTTLTNFNSKNTQRNSEVTCQFVEDYLGWACSFFLKYLHSLRFTKRFQWENFRYLLWI